MENMVLWSRLIYTRKSLWTRLSHERVRRVYLFLSLYLKIDKFRRLLLIILKFNLPGMET